MQREQWIGKVTVGMERRRVLLLCVQSLLGESVEKVLRQVEDVELIGPWTLDRHVLSRLSRIRPDTVLIIEGDEDERATSLMTQVLEQHPDLPIVRIGWAQNVIRIYTSRTLPAHSADLIQALRSLPARQSGHEPIPSDMTGGENEIVEE